MPQSDAEHVCSMGIALGRRYAPPIFLPFLPFFFSLLSLLFPMFLFITLRGGGYGKIAGHGSYSVSSRTGWELVANWFENWFRRQLVEPVGLRGRMVVMFASVRYRPLF